MRFFLIGAAIVFCIAWGMMYAVMVQAYNAEEMKGGSIGKMSPPKAYIMLLPTSAFAASALFTVHGARAFLDGWNRPRGGGK